MLRTIDQFFNNRELTRKEKEFLKKDKGDKELKICNEYIEPEFLDGDEENSYCNDYDSDPESGRRNSRREPGSKYRYNSNYDKKYVISLLGRNEKGDSMCCHVLGYIPALYILIPRSYEEITRNKKDNEKEEDIKGVEYYANRLIDGLKNQVKINKKHKGRIIGHEVITRKIYQGFRNGRKNYFVKILFDNDSSKRVHYYAITNDNFYISGIANRPLKVYEFKIPTFARFFHDRNILPQSWISVDKFINIPKDEKLTNCDYEFSTKYEYIETITNKKDPIPTVKLAWDIETAPKKRRKGHPELSQGDPVIQIGCSFLISEGSKLVGFKDLNIKGNNKFEGSYSIVFTLNKSNPSKKENFKIVECLDELDLLECFIDVLRKGPTKYFPEKLLGKDKNYKKFIPNYSITYNGNNFDWKYVYTRCSDLGIAEEFERTSCFQNFKCLYVEKKITSASMGKVNNSYLVQPGIINIDMLKIIDRMQITEMMDVKLKTSCDYFLLGNKKGHSSIMKFYKDSIDKYDKFKDKYDKEGLFTKDFLKYLKDTFEEFHSKDDAKDKSERAKIDLEYEEMYNYYFDALENKHSDKSKKKMELIAYYCERDCKVLHRLVDKISVIYNFESRSNVSRFPMKMILLRGVDIVNFCLLTYYTQKFGFLYPHVDFDEKAYEKPFYDELKKNKAYKMFYDNLSTEDKKEKEKKKFLDRFRIAGAIVFPPKSGVYYNISTLDVKSEYPSVIMTYNLSHDRIVLLDKQYGNIEGQKYIDIEWEGKDYHTYKEKNKDPFHRLKYKSKVALDIKNRKEEDEGVIVKVLKFLLAKRNAIKKSMKSMKKGSMEYMIANSEQLATKVYMNAIYGSLSYAKSPLFLKALGGMTTMKAREYLSECKRLVEEKFDAEIIYGDTDSIFIKWNIPDKYKTPEEKFYYVWDKSIEAENYINKTIHGRGLKYLTIELEKVFRKLTLFSTKKKYFGLLNATRNFDDTVLKIMGVKSKKRDSTKLEKFSGELIRYYVISDQMDKVLPLLKSIIKYTYDDLFGVEYFLKSARYKPPYKFPERIPHAVAVSIIKRADKGIQIDTNERVFYLYKRVKYGKGKRGGKIIPKKMHCVWPKILYNPDIIIDYKIYFDYLIKNCEDILAYILKVDPTLSKEQKTRYLKRNFTDIEVNKYEDMFLENGCHLKFHTLDDLIGMEEETDDFSHEDLLDDFNLDII